MDNTNLPNRAIPEGAAGPSSPGDQRRSPSRWLDELPAVAGTRAPWSLRDVYRALFRFRRRAALWFVVVLGLAAAGLVFCPRKYKSDAWLFVRLGRENVTLDPTATTGTPRTMIGVSVTREEEINSIIEVLGSRAMVEKVVAQVGFEESPANDTQREAAITRLMKSLTIGSPKSTTVIGVSCQAGSPQRAQAVVAALVELYLHEHLRLNSTAGSHEFFNEQAQLLKRQLDEAMAALRDAKNAFHLASVAGRQDALQKQLQAVETQILETESARAATEAKAETLRVALERLPEQYVREFAGPNTAASSMRRQLYDLQTREQELRAQYTPEHPSVVAIHQQVQEAERILREEQPDRTQATNAAVLNEQANLQSLQARAAALQQQLARLRADLTQLNEEEVKISELERQVKVTESNYLTYMASLEQTRVDEALKRQAISNLNVIQPASLVLKPVSPKIGLTVVLALLVAAGGAVGLALLSEHLDHSLRTPEDVERALGVPLLVSIPRVRARHLILNHLN